MKQDLLFNGLTLKEIEKDALEGDRFSPDTVLSLVRYLQSCHLLGVGAMMMDEYKVSIFSGMEPFVQIKVEGQEALFVADYYNGFRGFRFGNSCSRQVCIRADSREDAFDKAKSVIVRVSQPVPLDTETARNLL